MTSPELQRSSQLYPSRHNRNVNTSPIRPANDESAQISLQPSGAVPPITTDAGTSPLATENMSTGGQSPAQLATSPTTSMEINHPSPIRENITEEQLQQQQQQQHQQQQQEITNELDITLTITTEQIFPSTATEQTVAAAVAVAATVVATTTPVTTAPPVEPEVEWTTLTIDGREFRVPKALEIDPSFLAALPEEMRQEILTDQVRNFERE
ncbi:unnamed protein product, partial [Rotaria socialis]